MGAQTQWKNAAHKLKGVAGNMGMAALEALCLEAEKTAWPAIDQCGDLLQKIADEIAHIKAFIAQKNLLLLPPGE